MARLRARESIEIEADNSSATTRNSSRASSQIPPRHNSSHTSASPTPSNSSDKENSHHQRPSKTSMGPPPQPNKKPRLGERPNGISAQSSREGSVAYDPHQDITERQQLRKGLRDLSRDVADNRNDWLKPRNTGLLDAITQSNDLFSKVKQTSDATIDSRFLVAASDLAAKKTQQASVGDGSQGVDVDEFISKCITFMRRGDELEEQSIQDSARQSGTQSRSQRRRRRTELDGSDDEDEDTQMRGDAFNWAWLGSRACAPVISRPPLPSFLLGPLSLQKKARAPTQRRARQARANPEDAVKPRELQLEDLQQQESSSLMAMCKKLYHQLGEINREITQAEEAGVDEEELDELCERYHVLDDGGISLMHFVVNPKSFGQTVENLFYVSFLVRDGLVGIEVDSNVLPTLHWISRNTENEAEMAKSRGAIRYQSVFELDFQLWEDIIDAWNITESLIPDRSAEAEEQVGEGVGRTAWYG